MGVGISTGLSSIKQNADWVCQTGIDAYELKWTTSPWTELYTELTDASITGEVLCYDSSICDNSDNDTDCELLLNTALKSGCLVAYDSEQGYGYYEEQASWQIADGYDVNGL